MAINPGSCTITCKVGNSSKKAKVVVLPEKVTGLATLSKTKNSIQLKWKKQVNVKGYMIYMYDFDLKEYTRIKTVSGKFQTVTIRNLKKGKEGKS